MALRERYLGLVHVDRVHVGTFIQLVLLIIIKCDRLLHVVGYLLVAVVALYTDGNATRWLSLSLEEIQATTMRLQLRLVARYGVLVDVLGWVHRATTKLNASGFAHVGDSGWCIAWWYTNCAV